MHSNSRSQGAMTQLNRGMIPAEVENFDCDRDSKGSMGW